MLDIDTIDFRKHSQNISIAAKHAKTVASLLVNVAPKDLGDNERAALMRAVTKANAVEDIRAARVQGSPSRIEPMRNVMRSLAALHAGLDAVATIAPNRSDRGTRAAVIQRTLFPNGTGFVRADAPVLWQDAQMRLRWIEEQHLAEPIAQVLGGPELLDAVREATASLGETLGVGSTPRPMPSRDALQGARRAFLRAVKAYGRALAATVDEDEPASIQRYLDAVAPLDEYRVGHGAADEEGEPITTETPTVVPVA